MTAVVFERHFPLQNQDDSHPPPLLLPPTAPTPDLRASRQLTRANTLKTGVMRNASVIKWKEGNEVTVDSQFSQRKPAFIAHLILGSKQVSCRRLRRGI